MGQAVNFDGTNDTIKVDHSTTHTTALHNGFTVSAWVKPDTNGANSLGRIVDKSESTISLNGFSMYLRNNTAPLRSFSFNVNDATAIDSLANTVPLNVWTHVVATATSGGNVVLYANGGSVQTGTLNPTSQITTTNPLYVGSYENSGRQFDGIIDDVRIYDKPLSATEVRQLYELGR